MRLHPCISDERRVAKDSSIEKGQDRREHGCESAPRLRCHGWHVPARGRFRAVRETSGKRTRSARYVSCSLGAPMTFARLLALSFAILVGALGCGASTSSATQPGPDGGPDGSNPCPNTCVTGQCAARGCPDGGAEAGTGGDADAASDAALACSPLPAPFGQTGMTMTDCVPPCG